MERKQQIVEAFLGLVIAKNSCRFSMDQLANELGMSKKTIYSLFSSKEEIMMECALYLSKQMDQETKHLIEQEKNLIDLLYKKAELVANQLRFLSNELVKEIQQDYPRVWQLIDELRTERIKENEAIFAKGIELGLMKPIDPKLIGHIYQTCIQEITQQEFLLKHNLTMSEACQLVTSIMLEGILIEK